MAGGRHARTSATIYEYQPWHITAATISSINTQNTAAIIVGSNVVTPVTGTLMAGIVVGSVLSIAAGGGTAETVTVTAVTGTTFTATFAFTHTANTAITNATVTGAVGIGKVVAASTATTITGGVTTTITLGAVNANIVKGLKLYIFNATGPTSETFIVLSVSGTTVIATAPFANSYSGLSYIGTDDSTLMGNVVINKAGDAACVLTLYNGNPNIAGAVGLSSAYGQAFAILTAPSVAGNYQHQCLLDYGLFYTLAFSTAPDITVMYDDASQPLTQ